MILVFGKTGQVASELACFKDVICLGRDRANLINPNSCAAAIRHHKPHAVINAAAYTAVDQAESDKDAAHIVNAVAPTKMAKACAENNIPFINISTDYVFDGTGDSPWQETDLTAPLGVYGLTKRQGEIGVLDANPQAVIIRTSWVFSQHGANFLKNMLRLGASRRSLSIVADQFGGPTPAVSVAQACHQIITKFDASKTGVYHFAGAPETTWANFAREIFHIAKMAVSIQECSSACYPTAAKRPLNSRLDCSRIFADYGIKQPQWNTELKKIIVRQGSA